MKIRITLSMCFMAAAAWGQQTADSCANLAKLNLKDTKITLAQVVAAGEFVQPANPNAGGGRGSAPGGTPSPAATDAGRGGPAAAAPAGRGGGRGPSPVFKTLPAFCRVAVTLTPTSDSDIKSEIWLPMTGWNGKFQVDGNGGWAGSIGYPNLGTAVAAGFASGGTDTGHSTNGASFALDHPEKMLDFGYRAVHVTTVAGKALISAFYGDAPKEAYFTGCSTGGRMAMNAVQRYPTDFNGVIAGAQVNPMTRLHMGSMYNTTFAHKDEENYIPPTKYAMIHKAVIEACDALDGLKDGLIQNPMACKFDPKVLECKGADGPACLTTKQVAMANTIYGGAITSDTKVQIYPGWERGSEMGWNVTAGPQPEGPAVDTYRFDVFHDPNWDWHTLKFDSATVSLADKEGNSTINAVETDLKPFFAAGGKLLLYHGWSDPNVAPRNTVNYYNSVLKTMGGEAKVTNDVRLFMVPGMGHCGGGEGPNDFDKVGALDQWVTTGKAPDSIIASHSTDGKVDRTRPLCPYPQVAKYKGSGSIDDAANFVCSK
jgi:feruloyl esterase